MKHVTPLLATSRLRTDWSRSQLVLPISDENSFQVGIFLYYLGILYLEIDLTDLALLLVFVFLVHLNRKLETSLMPMWGLYCFM